MSDSSSSSGKQWLPLESNPDLMSKYIYNLGVNQEWQFHEVYGTDEGLLEIVPKPVIAVLLLFPISENSENHKKEQSEELKSKNVEGNSQVYHIKQTVGNACGTIGLIHAILNNREKVSLDKESWFAKFYEETKDLSFADRAEVLCKNDSIETAHQGLASEAKSDVNHSINDNLHFIAFINNNGRLYELDGCKSQPIDHGATSADTLLQDAAKVVKQFMDRDPNDVRFSLAALAPAGFDD
jgi:ubiquitin carboxyl-terminal hydrolase L3